MKTIRWGILGCGKIARKFATDLPYVENAELFAVGARQLTTAQTFANEYKVTHVHGSYKDLVSDPDVDVIYIATPHAMHLEHTLLCLNHDKPVLCEKPFAMDGRQSKQMIDLSRSRKVFLMEALWTKFLPNFQKVKQLIHDGELGEIRNMMVNFGFVPKDPIPPRVYDPALGGGSLLDLGIYNVFMALSFLGKPDSIEATMTPAHTGVDDQCAVLFKYKNGALAQLFSSFSCNTTTECDISGTKNSIHFGQRYYAPHTKIEYFSAGDGTRHPIPFDEEPGWGYHYEARHVGECLRKGLIESPVMSHQDTLDLMETLDKIRAIAGIHYTTD
jgi:predicted dehydrogenase